MKRMLVCVGWLALAPLALAQEPEPLLAPAETAGTQQVELEIGGHTAQVLKLFFTRDGKQLVSVGADQTVRYWDTETGEPRRVLRPPCYLNYLGHSRAAALAPDGKTLALFGRFEDPGKEKRPIVLLDVEEGRIDRVLELPSIGRFPMCLAFSPDGKQLAVGCGFGGATVWDVATGAEILAVAQNIALNDGITRAVAFAPDGQRLAVSMMRRVHVVAVPSGQVEATLPMPVDVAALAWAPQAPTLALGDRAGVTLWDGATRQVVKRHAVGYSRSLSWSADGKQLLRGAAVGGAGRVDVLDADSGKAVAAYALTTRTLPPYPNDAVRSPDGKWIASAAGPNHAVQLWDRGTGALKWTGAGRGGPVLSAGWSANGKAIGWGRTGDIGRPSEPRRLDRAFDLGTLTLPAGAALTQLDVKGFGRHILEQDGVRLAPKSGPTVTRDGAARVLVVPQGLCSAGTLLAGDRAALGSPSGAIRLLDTRSGKPIAVLAGHRDGVTDLVPSPDGKLLLSGSLDRTVKLWQLARPGEERLLLSLFVVGADWIAWTPEGYYAATPRGEQLMGWTAFHGFDRLRTFSAAERYRKQLHRPDVIKGLLATGSLKEALDAANAALKSADLPAPAGVTELDKLLPPTVTLTELPGRKGDTVKLRAEARAGSAEQPVQSLRVLVDGRALPGKQGVAESGRHEWTLKLPPGQHRVVVVARSAGASAVSNELPIDCRPPADKPVMHVLAVGIDRYADSGLDLTCAVNDARLLAGTLAQRCKGDLFHEVRRTVLLNHEATRAAIVARLCQLRATVKEHDLVVVFFAGHGARDKDEFYLLTHEAKVDELATSALSGSALRTALKEFPCQVLLMLDACHAAGFGATGKLARQALRPATDDAARTLTDDEVGVIVMCAAMGHEKAAERGVNGLFTKAVVAALTESQGVFCNAVTRKQYLHHLQSYVFDRVVADSQEQQHPFLHLPWIVESFALRTVPR